MGLCGLRPFNAYAADSRGLVVSLLRDDRDTDLLQEGDCKMMITTAADELLQQAQQAGVARPDIRTEDLLALVSSISLAAEDHDDDTQAGQLLGIAIEGLRPHRCEHTT